MATRQRVKLEVYVDLDPVPGAFDSPESSRQYVHLLLQGAIPHYHPVVLVAEEGGSETPRTENTWPFSDGATDD